MKPLYRKTLLRFLPIVFNLERANQLSPLPDKDLADFCPLIEPYQVTKNHNFKVNQYLGMHHPYHL
ncbi:transposase [Microcystis aeruginosa]|uniref:transposase n=1 Tax=Microcystis aeruginosa TaxID=1126 RepID=UPI0009313C03|nr:transposase [Microcystis aeruginosa]